MHTFIAFKKMRFFVALHSFFFFFSLLSVWLFLCFSLRVGKKSWKKLDKKKIGAQSQCLGLLYGIVVQQNGKKEEATMEKRWKKAHREQNTSRNKTMNWRICLKVDGKKSAFNSIQIRNKRKIKYHATYETKQFALHLFSVGLFTRQTLWLMHILHSTNGTGIFIYIYGQWMLNVRSRRKTTTTTTTTTIIIVMGIWR